MTAVLKNPVAQPTAQEMGAVAIALDTLENTRVALQSACSDVENRFDSAVTFLVPSTEDVGKDKIEPVCELENRVRIELECVAQVVERLLSLVRRCQL